MSSISDWVDAEIEKRAEGKCAYLRQDKEALHKRLQDALAQASRDRLALNALHEWIGEGIALRDQFCGKSQPKDNQAVPQPMSCESTTAPPSVTERHPLDELESLLAGDRYATHTEILALVVAAQEDRKKLRDQLRNERRVGDDWYTKFDNERKLKDKMHQALATANERWDQEVSELKQALTTASERIEELGDCAQFHKNNASCIAESKHLQAKSWENAMSRLNESLRQARETIAAQGREIDELTQAQADRDEELRQAARTLGFHHPDELKPRGSTWLHERRNWQNEVQSLRTHVAWLEADKKQLREELANLKRQGWNEEER